MREGLYQDLAKISRAIKDGELENQIVLTNSIKYAIKEDKKIHLLGLLSDGGVHSHINHIEGFLEFIGEYQYNKVFLHAFTDGRDVDPKSGIKFIERIEKRFLKRGNLASVIGRYYAMDRDNRWERIKEAYDLLVKDIGKPSDNFIEQLNKVIKKAQQMNLLNPFLRKILMVMHLPKLKMEML